MELLKRTVNTINKYSMLSKDDSILIGLSGGPDSVCLTIILDELKDNFNLSLRAVYVDHGLRPEEAMKEIAFCRTLCERLSIEFYSKTVNVKEYRESEKISIQEAARELRHQVFEEFSVAAGATKIALGHNADDQAETVLMHLLRGAGCRGLSGIPPVRRQEVRSQKSEVRSLTIIRPLIEIERAEIEEFLNSGPGTRDSGLPFMVDSSNLKTDYLRNWVRLKVMPELKKQSPALVYNIARSAEILKDEDIYLDTIITRIMEGLTSKRTDTTIELSLSPLENMEIPILRRLLREAIYVVRGTRKGIDFVHIEDIIKLIKSGKSGDMLNLSSGVRAIKRYLTLLITSEISLRLKTRLFNVPGELFLEENSITLKAEISESVPDTFNGKDTAVFDYNSLILPLNVRMRKKGDYFYPSGFGKRKKLQDFFVDNKVPRDKRDTVPIVVSGEDIIWVAGYRMDERFRVKRSTKRFLIIRKVNV